ncbi:MAG: hypothetical protein Q8M11_16825 [Sulfuritalea sp.]|nr:hypothetical protein [Sulfuritalea sp.]MDP1981819.1 hypothetical protein [Sulfuritalea sp.]
MGNQIQVTANLPQRLAGAIAREVDPEQVVLSSSHVHGATGTNSNVNFLVVDSAPFGPDHRWQTKIRRTRRARWDYPVPVDLLVCSRAEVAQWQESTTTSSRARYGKGGGSMSGPEHARLLERDGAAVKPYAGLIDLTDYAVQFRYYLLDESAPLDQEGQVRELERLAGYVDGLVEAGNGNGQ